MQVFSPSADTWLRAGLAALVVVVLGALLVMAGYADSTYATQAGWAKDQDVPFSHKHHAGELGIDCRYCHAGAETHADAGLPPTHVCMTCHSQIWTGAPMLAPVRRSLAENRPLRWHRVAQVPDYVYFNHSIHVKRGVPCVECHGRVDEMPLSWRAHPFQMQWCLDCHRDPAKRLKPPEQITRMDWSNWSDAQAQRYGTAAIRRWHIDTKKLDNCGICHR
ncbi:cytochrome c3 family protein [Novosphingobium sp. 9U]|uniref:cytochrome c3 family protein n=1 Tax=Novosphingobium sp. 9U TaxID=2653158 RepID=UPI0012F2342C|nr:cytochrome c3 family protein [Novosphingobium sp. 9U]VWX47359.1 Molybdopterin oxidoreductase subunit, predicted; chaperone protein HtpG [Novosphingobium sp. 9U]